MIDVKNLPLKYITGSYKYDPVYPTTMDLLFDIANTGKKSISVDDVDWIEDDVKSHMISELVDSGYIKLNNNKITIIKTDWDGWSN